MQAAWCHVLQVHRVSRRVYRGVSRDARAPAQCKRPSRPTPSWSAAPRRPGVRALLPRSSSAPPVCVGVECALLQRAPVLSDTSLLCGQATLIGSPAPS